MKTIDDYYFTENHEWICMEDGKARVGITDLAQKELGDIVFVELPEIGEDYNQFEEIAVIESVKAVSDVFVPASGVISDINRELIDHPELINEKPYQSGWIAQIEIEDKNELKNLMTKVDYLEFIEEEG